MNLFKLNYLLFIGIFACSCSSDNENPNPEPVPDPVDDGINVPAYSPNLLLHYPMDGNANDLSNNAFTGTVSGVTFGPDRFNTPNSAAYFDGLDDFIDFPNTQDLKPDFPISFSFWIKYDSEDYLDRDVFNTSFEDDINTGVFFNSQQSTGNYAVNFGDGSEQYVSQTRRTYVSNQTITINEWHHVVLILREATDMSIYIDCTEYGGEYSGTGGDLVYSDTPGTLGRVDRNLLIPENYFKGAIDDFRYWDREISTSEILELCNE